MGDCVGVRAILRAHANGEGRCRPDAVAAAGEAALDVIAAQDPRGLAYDAGRVLVFEGDCPFGGAAGLTLRAQEQARRFGLRLLRGADGCPLAVLRELGFAAPGALVATAGVVAARAGGEGALVWPLGSPALDELLRTGAAAVPAPQVYRVRCGGELSPPVGGVDVGLYVAGQFGPGGAEGAVLELDAPALPAAAARDALVAASLLCGARAALCVAGAAPDGDAEYEYDFTPLTPQYAAARDGGFDVGAVAAVPRAFVSRVVVGPADAADIGDAARVLAGARIHSDVEMWVAPASRAAHFDATAKGYLLDLIEAGAVVLPLCALPWAEEVADGAVATTTLCAFQACAARGLETYYVGAAAAAAAALAGELCDPSPLWR